MPHQLKNGPVYRGIKGYRDKEGGFVVWIPDNWVSTKLNPGHHGMLFSPYADDYNTSLLVEKHKLPYSVTEEDIPVLLAGFHEGMKALPGVEVEETSESLSSSINIFDARFSFLDGDVRRKRWVRNVYWGDGQLVIIAQGRTLEDFEYWLPMFFNTMTTAEVL